MTIFILALIMIFGLPVFVSLGRHLTGLILMVALK